MRQSATLCRFEECHALISRSTLKFPRDVEQQTAALPIVLAALAYVNFFTSGGASALVRVSFNS